MFPPTTDDGVAAVPEPPRTAPGRPQTIAPPAIPAMPRLAAPAVEVRDLVKVYRRPGGGVLRALNGISFAIRRSEIFGFLGPNGAGKTTALEIIEGLRATEIKPRAERLLTELGLWDGGTSPSARSPAACSKRSRSPPR